MKYIPKKGIFVGTFYCADIEKGLDQKAVAAVQAASGLEYTNSDIVYNKNGEPIALTVYVCKLEDMYTT